MHCRDPIYGSAEIDEPVLTDLLETLALQCLDGILQYGISGLVGVTSPTTRLEHSIGTMLLVWTTDDELWAKLVQSDDGEVQRWLPLVSADTRFSWDEAHADWWVSTKIRTLDPDVALNSKVVPLSALDPEFARYQQVYLERKRGRWPIRVLGVPDKGHHGPQ